MPHEFKVGQYVDLYSVNVVDGLIATIKFAEQNGYVPEWNYKLLDDDTFEELDYLATEAVEYMNTNYSVTGCFWGVEDGSFGLWQGEEF
jgi:hypothetical protein